MIASEDIGKKLMDKVKQDAGTLHYDLDGMFYETPLFMQWGPYNRIADVRCEDGKINVFFGPDLAYRSPLAHRYPLDVVMVSRIICRWIFQGIGP